MVRDGVSICYTLVEGADGVQKVDLSTGSLISGNCIGAVYDAILHCKDERRNMNVDDLERPI